MINISVTSNKDIIKKFMRNVLIESLGFIETNKDSSPLKYDDYVDINVDYINKQWYTYSKRAINLDKWEKKDEMLSLPEVEKAVNYFHTFDNADILNPESEEDLFIKSLSKEDQRIQKYRILLIVNAYINKYGLSFDEQSFDDYIFNVWFTFFQKSATNKRIFVLRNLNLDGFDQMNLLGYTIRPLKNYEIRNLILIGAYNSIMTQYRFNIPPGIKGELNPMYCVEGPTLEFGKDNVEISSEFLKNRLLGLLLTYKEGIVSMDTEMYYDALSEFQLYSGLGVTTNHSELQRHFSSLYVLSHAEYDKLREYEGKFKSINLEQEKPLSLAIKRYLGSMWRFDNDDMIIDYMIALESLLSTSGQDIQYRISLFAAFLLNDDPSDRRKTFDIMKGFYDLRSKIVHGSVNQLNKARKELEQLIPQANFSPENTLREYTRRIIREYINSYENTSFGNYKKYFLNKLKDKILGVN